MPYITKERRAEMTPNMDLLATAGELNYAITLLIDKYLNTRAIVAGRQTTSYADINEVIGVLECAKLELYRRIAAPYEDTKIVSNGDVYTIGVSNG